MIYVFTFLGEFGYELLNWQGVVRKFAATIGPSVGIVCCSRGQVRPLYETADVYIDLAGLPQFQQSVACGYFALHPSDLDVHSWRNWWFDRQLKAACMTFIRSSLTAGGIDARRPIRWIFSSDDVTVNGCRFGCRRSRYGREHAEGNIYDLLPLENNLFRRIKPELSIRGMIEARLGWSLEEPFVLCQTRTREIVQRSSEQVPVRRIVELLARRIRVVLLSFQTGRHLDSSSSLSQLPGCTVYACESFVDQACLIQCAQHCLFFTEGDFGSHIYVPPFLGRHVIACAPQSVYTLGTTPIKFWNRHVFRFGGHIIPKITDSLDESPSTLQEMLDDILACSASGPTATAGARE